MRGRAYYNENDPYAAQWLRNLIAAGLIAPGDVDDRSITEVRPDDFRGYAQVHFFAGIAGWSRALRLAGWADDRPVWTGSCPCQPFSVAGKRKGFDDSRHLWPVWRDLIRQCRPPVVLGEQVAAASDWLRLVRGDLEALGYAVGAIPVEAASAGADHLRDRLWFVADDGLGRCSGSRERQGEQPGRAEAERAGDPGGNLGFTNSDGRQSREQTSEAMGHRCAAVSTGRSGVAQGDACGQGLPLGSIAEEQRGDVRLEGAPSAETGDRGFAMADTDVGGDLADANIGDKRRHAGDSRSEANSRGGEARPQNGNPPHGSCASGVEWVIGADGKARRTLAGICLLAHGVPARVGKLRAFGNAIDPRPAAAFITAAFPDLTPALPQRRA